MTTRRERRLGRISLCCALHLSCLLPPRRLVADLRREEDLVREMVNDARKENERTLRECVRLR